VKTAVSLRRARVGVGLGNTLQVYDWVLFGLLSASIGPHFFATSEPVSATLSALAVFAVGFAVRPLAGVALGMVADKVGRRTVTLWSVALMTTGTLVIAVTPSYATIGIWSSGILLVCRLLQGIAAGIEAPLSTAYVVELAEPGHEGRAAGTMSFFVTLGVLLASLASFCTSLVLGAEVMDDGGWRIPLLVGALMGAYAFQLRRTLPKTLETVESPASSASIWRGVGRHWLGVVATVFVVGGALALEYALNVGLPNMARSRFGEDATEVFAIMTVASIVTMIGVLLTGALADRYRLSRTFVATRLLAVPAVFVILLYGQPGIAGFAVVVLGGSIVLALNFALYNVIATSLMPKAYRATGVALGYGIAAALFGGTAPYLLLWLEGIGATWLFLTYIAVLCLASVVLYLLARRAHGTFAGE
jgi:MFS transporter, MHS family, alpha-ketoglutarate permease